MSISISVFSYLFNLPSVYLYVSHQPGQVIYYCRIPVIKETAFSCIHCCNHSHVLFAQGEIKYLEIFFHPLPLYALWNADNTSLDQPAQHYLSNALSVFAPDFLKNFILEKAVFAFCKRRPAWAFLRH